MNEDPVVVALAGGVGGARLAHGLAQCCDRALTVVVNTGDDFEHLGLHISPDIDTVLYTLASLANLSQGWGLANESWNFLEQVRRLGAPDWFQLGDRDLATHVIRTDRMRKYDSLTTIVADLARQLGLASRILPMTDAPVRTVVMTADGELPFQDYFVRLRCKPVATGFRFAGIEDAKPTANVLAALSDPSLAAIVICPSNPYVSIDPILSLDGMRAAIASSPAPVVAISPIIGGQAVKGPAAKMMTELNHEISPVGIARHYGSLLSGLMIDHADTALKPLIEELGIKVEVADILMRDVTDRARLAKDCLVFAESISAQSHA